MKPVKVFKFISIAAQCIFQLYHFVRVSQIVFKSEKRKRGGHHAPAPRAARGSFPGILRSSWLPPAPKSHNIYHIRHRGTVQEPRDAQERPDQTCLI
jgi:hypothetical protein